MKSIIGCLVVCACPLLAQGQTSMIMQGALGRYPMALDGSGTAWNPGASPMFMKMLPKSGRYDLGLMGIATLNYTEQGGPRGASQFFTNSMAMLMAQENTGGGTLAFRGMFSADLLNGEKGYPLLFQTGETAFGKPLVDRQHPHDLVSELAGSFSKPIASDWDGFVYAGLIGEPALGDTMYLHRPSSGDNVETPISHHWFDSTHISYGVLTLGTIYQGQVKVEGSVFNGAEPDENRANLDPVKFDSYSGRVEFNPTPALSLSASYGFLKSPEATEPGIGVHRTTVAIQHQLDFSPTRWLSTAAYFGRNTKEGNSRDAWALEGAYTFDKEQVFGRLERVDKDELVGVPAGVYTINKLTLGYSHSIARRDGLDWALAGNVDFYSFPSELNAYYGSRPVSFGLYLRVRPERMIHHMGG